MFKVYKQSSFGKLNFQNGVTGQQWKQTSNSTAQLLNLFRSFEPIWEHSYIQQGEKNPFASYELQSWTLPLFFLMWVRSAFYSEINV